MSLPLTPGLASFEEPRTTVPVALLISASGEKSNLNMLFDGTEAFTHRRTVGSKSISTCHVNTSATFAAEELMWMYDPGRML